MFLIANLSRSTSKLDMCMVYGHLRIDAQRVLRWQRSFPCVCFKSPLTGLGIKFLLWVEVPLSLNGILEKKF